VIAHMLDRVDDELEHLGVAPPDARLRRPGAAPGACDDAFGGCVPAALVDTSTRMILRRLKRELTRAYQDRTAEQARRQLA
jgi:hypothetical protein